MVDQETEAQFKQAFIRRVKEARVALGMKQWQMAEALDMGQDKYKQYESRSFLPHHLLIRFCLITRIDSEWLLTGRGKKPIKPLQIVETEVPARPVRKTAKKTRSGRAA